MDVVHKVVDVGMFLKVEGCAFNEFDDHDDVVVVDLLVQSRDLMRLASRCFA